MIYLLLLWSWDVFTWMRFAFNMLFPPVSALRRINAIIRIAMAPRPYSYLHCPLANPRWALGGCVSQHLFPIWPSTYPFVHISLVGWKLLWSWLFAHASWTATAWPNTALLLCTLAVADMVRRSLTPVEQQKPVPEFTDEVPIDAVVLLWCACFVMQRHCMTLTSGVYKMSGFT